MFKCEVQAWRHAQQQQVHHNFPKPGDTITNLSPQRKHTARDMYLVMTATPTQVTAQKILHPLTQNISKLMSKQYITHPKHTRILFSPIPPPPSNLVEPAVKPRRVPDDSWSPIPRAFWDSDSDEKDEIVLNTNINIAGQIQEVNNAEHSLESDEYDEENVSSAASYENNGDIVVDSQEEDNSEVVDKELSIL